MLYIRNMLYNLINAHQPECVNLIQAIVFIEAQHDVFHHVKAFLLFPRQTFAHARVTRSTSGCISATIFIVLIVLRRKR